MGCVCVCEGMQRGGWVCVFVHFPQHVTIHLSELALTNPKCLTAHPPPTFCQMEAVRDRADDESKRGMRRESTPAPGQTSVMQFLTKLRRHASLEGAGPYFKRWKFDSGHRAASLDAKGWDKFHLRLIDSFQILLHVNQVVVIASIMFLFARIPKEEAIPETKGSK